MKCVVKRKLISTSLTFALGAVYLFLKNFGITFLGGTQKRPSVKNSNMGLKTTLVTPFHNAVKGQKRTLFGDLFIVTCYTVGWALIAGDAPGWLPLLSGAAANLALFGLSPLCQQTLNSGANAGMEGLCSSPISCFIYWDLLPSCETVPSPFLAKCPFWLVKSEVLCFLVYVN